MSSYKPIKKQNKGAADRIISIEKLPFEAAPALSFLNRYEETITANPVLYDPLKPERSDLAPVTYNISRTINTLSDRTVALRHNGDSADMEISVDTYSYIPKEPIVAEYSLNPKLPKIRQGDVYNRSTITYIYRNIAVPKASNKIWDGRYTRCVDLQGYDVDSGNRLPEIIQAVQSKLDNPTELYTVLPVAGMATTVAPPRKDPYAATYKVKVQQFISVNYNSLALTKPPRRRADSDLYQELPQEGGDRKFELQEAFVAAVLDGPYFVRWANVYRYVDKAPDAGDDCCHQIVEYEDNGDAVIKLNCLCGPEFEAPPAPDPDDNFTCSQYAYSFGYVSAGEYELVAEPDSSLLSACGERTPVITARVEDVEPVSNLLSINHIPIDNIQFPFITSGPVSFKLSAQNSSAPLYLNHKTCWSVSCVDSNNNGGDNNGGGSNNGGGNGGNGDSGGGNNGGGNPNGVTNVLFTGNGNYRIFRYFKYAASSSNLSNIPYTLATIGAEYVSGDISITTFTIFLSNSSSFVVSNVLMSVNNSYSFGGELTYLGGLYTGAAGMKCDVYAFNETTQTYNIFVASAIWDYTP